MFVIRILTNQFFVGEMDIPAQKYRSVLKKFSGATNWPQQSVILPGNEILFSLETASYYVKDSKVVAKIASSTLNFGLNVNHFLATREQLWISMLGRRLRE